MPSKETTVEDYLAELPEDRREAIIAVRNVIKCNLQPGFEEGMQYGAIGYYVPHSIYPKGYHCDKKQPVPFLGLANQKQHMALYMFFLYIDAALRKWFEDAYNATGKKLDMGKSCVRFKKLDDLPIDVIGECVRRVSVEAFLKQYEAGLKP